MLSLSGHLGDRVAALVDGQLPADQEERAWQHVVTCPGCRQAVEQESATKQLLGGLVAGPAAPRRSWLDPEALAAWDQVRALESQARRRHLAAGGLVTASLASVVLALGVTGVLPVTPGAGTPSPASIRGDVVGPVPTADLAPPPVGSDPGRVGSPTGGETSHALWLHGSSW